MFVSVVDAAPYPVSPSFPSVSKEEFLNETQVVGVESVINSHISRCEKKEYTFSFSLLTS